MFETAHRRRIFAGIEPDREKDGVRCVGRHQLPALPGASGRILPSQLVDGLEALVACVPEVGNDDAFRVADCIGFPDQVKVAPIDANDFSDVRLGLVGLAALTCRD